MSWRNDLIARLRGDAALAGLLGTRIAFFEAARNWSAYPQLVLQEITPGREYTHDGPDGLDRPRLQFDIYGEGSASVYAVEAALLAEMEQKQVEQGATRFHFAVLENRVMLDPEDIANQKRIQRMQMDFTFFHEAI